MTSLANSQGNESLVASKEFMMLMDLKDLQVAGWTYSTPCIGVDHVGFLPFLGPLRL